MKILLKLGEIFQIPILGAEVERPLEKDRVALLPSASRERMLIIFLNDLCMTKVG